MSAALPAALALAGTALTAITIFAPFRAPASVMQSRIISPVAGECAEMPSAPMTADSFEPAANGPCASSEPVPWTVRVDPAATACDASARADLAEALGTLQAPWAQEILRYAGEVESDPLVRSAIAAGLSVSSSQSLVT